MPTYVVLFEKTEEGQKITAEDAQRRRATGIELINEHEAELKALYYGFGEYDMFAVVDVDDSETMAKIKLAYEQQGLSRTKGFEVFEPEEWDAIIEDAL
ncbi:MAG: hypothetical protein ACI8U4_001433 [Natronomonas sp.]|jgi:uncharacterized protein with GYD domain